VLGERRLEWDGCLNVRDLGGHATEDGETTLRDHVVRSDSVGNLSAAGWDALVAYGIRTVVDLRFDEERAADPPIGAPVDVVHVSILGDLDPERLAALDARAAAEPDQVASTRLVYLAMLDAHADRFAAAVAAVADAPEGGVLVHCQGGKDRTGLVTALLLRLAGVDHASIAADYDETTANLADRHERWIAEAEDEDERARRRRIAASPGAAMLAVLEELERRYGSVAGYLRAGGATDEQLARARARLRGDDD
jgi:protein tyrosine/serine phosphatase